MARLTGFTGTCLSFEPVHEQGWQRWRRGLGICSDSVTHALYLTELSIIPDSLVYCQQRLKESWKYGTR